MNQTKIQLTDEVVERLSDIPDGVMMDDYMEMTAKTAALKKL